MCESHSGLKGWMWKWWSVHLNCFGSRVGLHHRMLKYSQFETKRGFHWTLTLVNQENALNTWFQNNGTRHWVFWRPLIKLDPHTLCNMQRTFQHIYFSAFRKEMKSDRAPFPLPPTPAALLNVELGLLKKRAADFTNNSSVKSTSIFRPSTFTSEKTLICLFVTMDSSAAERKSCRLTLI